MKPATPDTRQSPPALESVSRLVSFLRMTTGLIFAQLKGAAEFQLEQERELEIQAKLKDSHTQQST